MPLGTVSLGPTMKERKQELKKLKQDLKRSRKGKFFATKYKIVKRKGRFKDQFTVKVIGRGFYGGAPEERIIGGFDTLTKAIQFAVDDTAWF